MHANQDLSGDAVAAIESDLQKALISHQSNQLQKAHFYYQSVLNKNPDHVPACLNLGALLLRCGAEEEGIGLMARAATHAVVERNTGMLFFIGTTLSAAGRLIEARTSYRQVLEIDPQHVNAHCNLAVTLNGLGRMEEAAQSYRRALQIQPDHVDALVNLGVFLREQGNFQESEALIRDALQRNPRESRLHYNLGVTLEKAGHLHKAEVSLRTALQIAPNFSDACSYLGSIRAELGFPEEAVACYRYVLQLQPDSEIAHFSLGMALLASGHYPEGWRECEHRWRGGLNKADYPPTTLPQWKGQDVQPGASIVIFQEQGLGDKIQFSRYLKQLPNQFSGGVSMVLDSHLTRLFRRSFPDCTWLETVPENQQRWQWQCPLMSLPLAFETTTDTIPAAPYLIADPQRVMYFANKITQLNLVGVKPKIGVVWKSTGGMVNAGSRSLAFEQISALFNLPDTAWFSLQKEPGTDEQAMRASDRLTDWSAEFGDFDDTAALIMNLDLVIAVDTSVAHLAGALGKPVWLLNRHASEWRWMHDREDSPWYASMRIFTQRVAGEWDGVIDRVTAALRESAISTESGSLR